MSCVDGKECKCTRPSAWIGEDGPADDRVIRLKVSPGQRAAFDAAAKACGKSLSAWLRDVALADCSQRGLQV